MASPSWCTRDYVRIPDALFELPRCKPHHVTVYRALAKNANWETGRVDPNLSQRELTRLSLTTRNTVRGIPKRSVAGALDQLLSWGALQQRVDGLYLVPPPWTPPPAALSLFDPPPSNGDPPLAREERGARTDQPPNRAPQTAREERGARTDQPPNRAPQTARDTLFAARDRAIPSSYTDLPDSSEGSSPNGADTNGAFEKLSEELQQTSIGHAAVKTYVDAYRETSGGAEPPERFKQIVGRLAKELAGDGKSRELIDQAIRQLVAKGKSPKLLIEILVDIELGIHRSGNGHSPNRHVRMKDEWPESAYYEKAVQDDG